MLSYKFCDLIMNNYYLPCFSELFTDDANDDEDLVDLEGIFHCCMHLIILSGFHTEQ